MRQELDRSWTNENKTGRTKQAWPKSEFFVYKTPPIQQGSLTDV